MKKCFVFVYLASGLLNFTNADYKLVVQNILYVFMAIKECLDDIKITQDTGQSKVQPLNFIP